MFSTWNSVASSGGDGDDDAAFVRRGSGAPSRRSTAASLGGLDREDVVVLVLEVAGLVRPQTGERVRDRRRLQADGRHGAEIHGVGHGENLLRRTVPVTIIGE